MSNERTPQEQAAYEKGQRVGLYLTDAMESVVKKWYTKAFPDVPYPEKKIVDADDAKALPPKLMYKGIEEHVFRSDDWHTLLDMVQATSRTTPVTPESQGYIDSLKRLEDRLMAIWCEIRPGQEAVCTIREEREG